MKVIGRTAIVLPFCFLGIMSIEIVLCLGLVTISDIRSKRIPNSLILAIFLVGIVSGRVSNAESLVGAILMPLVLMFLSSKFPIGGGDIKLISALGFCLGFWNQMVFLLVGLSLSLAVSLIRQKKTIILAPFISFGGIIALIIGDFLVKYLIMF